MKMPVRLNKHSTVAACVAHFDLHFGHNRSGLLLNYMLVFFRLPPHIRYEMRFIPAAGISLQQRKTVARVTNSFLYIFYWVFLFGG